MEVERDRAVEVAKTALETFEINPSDGPPHC